MTTDGMFSCRPGVHGTVEVRNMDGSALFEQAVMDGGHILYRRPREEWWNPASVSCVTFIDGTGSGGVPVCPCCGEHAMRMSNEVPGAMECPACGYCDSDGGADCDREPGELDV